MSEPKTEENIMVRCPQCAGLGSFIDEGKNYEYGMVEIKPCVLCEQNCIVSEEIAILYNLEDSHKPKKYRGITSFKTIDITIS